jgi:putative transposase
LCVSVAPTILVSDFIGKLKGSSSHEANQKLGHKVLEWQTGYGVVSFGSRDLDWVKDYVKNQRDRHARGRIEGRLETTVAVAEEPEGEPREAP